MAAMQENVDHSAQRTIHSVAHPLCPLSGSEISTTSEIIRSVWPENTDLRFKVITLEEPSKHDLAPYIEAEHSGARLPQLERRVFVTYYIRNTVSSITSIAMNRANGVEGPLP